MGRSIFASLIHVPPAASGRRNMDGFRDRARDSDRVRDSDRADRERSQDGGPGSVGLVTGAAMSKSEAALGPDPARYVGSGASRCRRSRCSCSAVAETRVLLTWRNSRFQGMARASVERWVTERNRLTSV
jgi:hypothetical protein